MENQKDSPNPSSRVAKLVESYNRKQGQRDNNHSDDMPLSTGLALSSQRSPSSSAFSADTAVTEIVGAESRIQTVQDQNIKLLKENKKQKLEEYMSACAKVNETGQNLVLYQNRKATKKAQLDSILAQEEIYKTDQICRDQFRMLLGCGGESCDMYKYLTYFIVGGLEKFATIEDKSLTDKYQQDFLKQFMGIAATLKEWRETEKEFTFLKVEQDYCKTEDNDEDNMDADNHDQ